MDIPVLLGIVDDIKFEGLACEAVFKSPEAPLTLLLVAKIIKLTTFEQFGKNIETNPELML